MANKKDTHGIKCLICKDKNCQKSMLNKLRCSLFVTKNFIKSICILLIAIVVPIVINKAYMIGSDVPNTIFTGYHLLAYAGACIFGLAVYWQTRKIHKKNQELQERSLRLENHNLQYNTFVYLNVIKIETTADYHSIKTYTLDKAIPWPLDVWATPYGYPNGIPQEFPKKYRKKLNAMIKKDKESFPNGLNSPDFQEDSVEEKVYFGYKTENSHVFPSIDPYKGIHYAGNNSDLVLWQRGFPIPRYYRYYTPITLTFYAKSSRADFFVDLVEIENFELLLECSGKKLYSFKDNLSYFADIIREIFIVKPTAIAENSYYSNNYKCDHAFSVNIHLCHDYGDLLNVTNYGEIDIKFDAAYINTFGVKTKRRQEFKVGAVVSEIIESQILGANGLPIKREVKKKLDLQTYSASNLDIDINARDERYR